MVVHSIERRWRVERQCEEVIRSASLVRWSLWEHASLGVCGGEGVGGRHVHGSAFWCMHTAGPGLLLAHLSLIPFPPVFSRVKLVPPVLVVLKVLKVLVVNLAILGPLGRLVPL